jgi:hypothetical protein
MIRKLFLCFSVRKSVFIFTGLLFVVHLYAQYPDTLRGRNIYNPETLRPKDTTVVPVSQPMQSKHIRDSLKKREKFVNDSIRAREKFVRDSIDARLKFIRDSIEARLQFIRDSLEARRKFIRDSILRRKRIIDSLTFLKTQLPPLIEASLRAAMDDIIIYTDKIQIVGDSTLSNYTYWLLPFNLTLPFSPWKSTINLSDNPIKINVDTVKNEIVSIKTPHIKCSFKYGRNNILRINEASSILNKRSIILYKSPFDSVFIDRRGNIVKIKRYIQYYQVTGSYQRGAPLFLHLSQVKQFEYNANNLVTRQQIVSFCDRWSTKDENKVCNIITYTINKQGNNYLLTRRNDPVNEFSDGTFNFEFDNSNNLKSVSFKNVKNLEDWKCFVEVNTDGYVSRYVRQNKGVVHQTLLINYYLDDPYAKHKYETITCTFEDDGVSYYQRNNTTGKERFRDKLTGAWGPWQ